MSLESLEAILATIDDEDTKAGLLKAYQDDLQAEKDLGISKYNKKDSELLKLKGAVKDTGYNPDIHGTLKEYAESLKTVIDEGNNSTLELQALKGELGALKESLANEKITAKDAKKRTKL